MKENYSQHAPYGMVNVFSMKCRTESCGKCASFGVAGTKTVEYCVQHAPNGMVDGCSRKCRSEGCMKKAIVWRDRYKNGGVLCAARTGWGGRRLQKKVPY